MLHGRKAFDRILYAFNNVLKEPVTWLFHDLNKTRLYTQLRRTLHYKLSLSRIRIQSVDSTYISCQDHHAFPVCLDGGQLANTHATSRVRSEVWSRFRRLCKWNSWMAIHGFARVSEIEFKGQDRFVLVKICSARWDDAELGSQCNVARVHVAYLDVQVLRRHPLINSERRVVCVFNHGISW